MSDSLAVAGLSLAVLMAPLTLRAQVGDISDVNYPGWKPADRVDPTIVDSASFAGGEWTYRYTLKNGPGAEQDILEFKLHLAAPPRSRFEATPPDGWWRMRFPPPSRVPGMVFMGKRPDPPDYPLPPSPYQILPGDSLSGFEVISPYPPGYARAYVRGYVALPDPGEGGPGYVFPDDTTDAQRRWTVGPTVYPEVLTRGTGGETYDGFLGFMSLRQAGTVMLDPAPVAVKFAVDGEQVFRDTFSATLNGVDVTDAFHPGPPDGADLTALFRVAGSPLLEGPNVLVTSVEGIDPATGQRVTDLDTVSFTVDPHAEGPSQEPF